MRALDSLPSPHDFDKVPLEIKASDLDALRATWQVESLGMMLNYKMNWTEWHAIREFVQNALDATEKVTLLYENQEQISYVVDNGSGIILRHMFLGEQKGETEREINCLRGRFGEGMKLSLLPLMRNGSRVLIRTKGTDYHFVAVERIDPKGVFYQINMLSQPNLVTQGTVIAIEKVDCLKYRNKFAPMLVEMQPESVLLTVRGGPEEYGDCKVRQVFNVPCQIFVRDIYVCSINAIFGYNFWFEDTRQVLSTDRNELRDSFHNIRKEFRYLAKASNPAFVKLLFSTIYESTRELTNPVTKESFPVRDSLEWYSLNNVNTYTDADAVAFFEVIFDLVGKEFSWSRDVKEQKTLEHHRIIDLKGRFPDMRDLLAKAGLVKDPLDLSRAAELTNETVVISADDFRNVDLGGVEQDIVQALDKIHQELDCVRHELCKYDQWSPLHKVKILFYAGNFKGSEEKVAGYYERQTQRIYIHVKNIDKFHETLRVFIHELAHASCNDCIDISQEFEDAMQSIAANFIELALDGTCDVEGLKNACKELSRNDREFDQVVQEKVLIVGNPLNLIRPENINSQDRDLLDQVFLQISHGAYADFDDITPILWGFSPNTKKYNMSGNCRGKTHTKRERMTDAEIVKEDLITLRKLKIELPLRIKEMTIPDDGFRLWITLLSEGFRDDLHGTDENSLLLVANEDWSKPGVCLDFVREHPSRHIKNRNFKAFINLINPFPSEWKKTADPEQNLELTRQRYWKGEFANQQWLQKLRDAAPEIMSLEHPAQKFSNFDFYEYPLKTNLLDWADKLGWLEVLKEARACFDPGLRKKVIIMLDRWNQLNALIDMNSQETNLENLCELLGVFQKRLSPEELKAIVNQSYDRYYRLINDAKQDPYAEKLANHLERIHSAKRKKYR